MNTIREILDRIYLTSNEDFNVEHIKPRNDQAEKEIIAAVGSDKHGVYGERVVKKINKRAPLPGGSMGQDFSYTFFVPFSDLLLSGCRVFPGFVGLDPAPAASGIVFSKVGCGGIYFYCYHWSVCNAVTKTRMVIFDAKQMSFWVSSLIGGIYPPECSIICAVEDVPYIRGYRIIQQALFTGALCGILTENNFDVKPIFPGYIKKFVSLERSKKPVDFFTSVVSRYSKSSLGRVSNRILGDVSDAFVLNLIAMAGYFNFVNNEVCHNLFCKTMGLNFGDVTHVMTGVSADFKNV